MLLKKILGCVSSHCDGFVECALNKEEEYNSSVYMITFISNLRAHQFCVDSICE